MTERLFLNGKVRLLPGDCLAILPTLAENSVDSVVCDPPYHLTSIVKRFSNGEPAHTKTAKDIASLSTPMARHARGFMNQKWDGGDIAFRPDTWAGVLRVLKPGGHLVAFAAPKNAHRMVCAIEDAGFEIRDTLMWIFGSGFPKSHDVSKAIDKAAGAEREVVGPRRLANGRAHEYNIGFGEGEGFASQSAACSVTAPATDAARQWEGWGSALKPSYEPICLARKPLSEGTIAGNVLKWGCGALNIGKCRIGDNAGWSYPDGRGGSGWHDQDGLGKNLKEPMHSTAGRWPANLIHDGSEEVVGAFPETAASPESRPRSPDGPAQSTWSLGRTGGIQVGHGDSGSAARFFYSSKADSDDRLGSKHPTVKPLDLIQYLVRLVTPPRGTVLDCFAGTGTTGEAAWREGFSAILIEREPEYLADIERRMSLCLSGPDERARESIKARLVGKPVDAGPLFASVAIPPPGHVVCPECNGNPPFERGSSGWGCETCWSHGYILADEDTGQLFGAPA